MLTYQAKFTTQLILYLFISISGICQFKKLEKAQKSIRKNEWQDAKEYLSKYRDDNGETPEYHFITGILEIKTASDQSGFEKALEIFEKSEQSLLTFEPEHTKKICEDFGYCLDSIKFYRRNLEEIIYSYFKKENSVQKMNDFLNKYSYFRNYSIAKRHRDSLAYSKIADSENQEEIKHFINTYSDTEFKEKAKGRLEDVEYRNAKKINSINELTRFTSN